MFSPRDLQVSQRWDREEFSLLGRGTQSCTRLGEVMGRGLHRWVSRCKQCSSSFMTQPMGFGGSVSALGLGKKWGPLPGLSKSCGKQWCFAAKQFPRTQKGWGCMEVGEGRRHSKLSLLSRNTGLRWNETLSVLPKQTNRQLRCFEKIRKKHWEGQSCWQKCFRNVFAAPLPVIGPTANTSNRSASHLHKHRLLHGVGDAVVAGQEEQEEVFLSLGPGTDMFGLGMTDSGEWSSLLGWLLARVHSLLGELSLLSYAGEPSFCNSSWIYGIVTVV